MITLKRKVLQTCFQVLNLPFRCSIFFQKASMAKTKVFLKFLALQQDTTINIALLAIVTEDAQAIDPIDKECSIRHLNQEAPKEDSTKPQVLESQPSQSSKKSMSNDDPREVDNNTNLGPSKSPQKESINNDIEAQDLKVEGHGELEPLAGGRPMLTIIFSLCGLLLRWCWQKSNKLKSLKFEREYVVL